MKLHRIDYRHKYTMNYDERILFKIMRNGKF